MAADAQEISKVDSAVSGISPSPKDDKHVPAKKRTSSSATGVMNINDLEKDGVELQIAKETQKLNWYCTLSCLASSCLAFKSRSFMFALVFRYRKGRVDADAAARKLNTSPGTIDDKDALKKMLTTPPVKKIDLHFPLGLEVTARNLKGVTIKDALDAIHKQFKKKADDELENPILAGFEWDKDESWTRLVVHQKKEGAAPSKKSKKNKAEDD